MKLINTSTIKMAPEKSISMLNALQMRNAAGEIEDNG